MRSRVYNQDPDEIERQVEFSKISAWLAERESVPDNVPDPSVICPGCRLPYVAGRMCSVTDYRYPCVRDKEAITI